MNLREFDRLLARDWGCVHCGTREGLVPHHRANRGMGGSKLLDTPSNLLVVCSWLNGAMEADYRVARMAREQGWKLRRWQEPAQTPLWDAMRLMWVVHDDEYQKTPHGAAQRRGGAHAHR